MSRSPDTIAAAKDLLTAESEMAIYRAAVELLEDLVPAETCKIATIEDESLVVQVETTNGVEVTNSHIPLSDDELAVAIRQGEARRFDDLAAVRSASDTTRALSDGFRSLVCVPFDGTGLLLAAADAPGVFSAADVAQASLVGAFIVAAIEHTRDRDMPRSEDLLAEVASILSHDLQSPLAVADGNLELLRGETESDRLDTIAAALDRLETMRVDLVTLTRTGRRVDATDTVTLDEIAEAAWEMVETAQADLVVEDTGTFNADRSRLSQVFENLFRNAIGHGGPMVSIRVGRLPDGAGIYVEDDGPGVPPERHEHVFDIGYSSTPDQPGFGLAISRRIVEAHGWIIRIDEGADGGAHFEITGIDFHT